MLRKENLEIKAIIFDLDNLLIDSYKDHFESFYYVLKKRGFKIKKEDVFRKFGVSAFELVRGLIPKIKNNEIKKIVQEKEEEYRKILRKRGVKIFSGVKELLDFLKKKKIKLIISSSASEENISLILKKSFLGKYFKKFVASEHTKKHKPNPEPLIKAAKIIRISPKNCIYVGDSIYEMIAAKRAKMFSVAILSGSYSRKELKKAGANLIFKDIKEFKKFLEKIL
ncbi:MAG: beta-phosphoglucomutase [Candidatus Pacearchaeota archaeon]|nr:MAG: beta-phosphoglucomutase [Candidatus Pacearchaeota archaeon]